MRKSKADPLVRRWPKAARTRHGRSDGSMIQTGEGYTLRVFSFLRNDFRGIPGEIHAGTLCARHRDVGITMVCVQGKPEFRTGELAVMPTVQVQRGYWCWWQIYGPSLDPAGK